MGHSDRHKDRDRDSHRDRPRDHDRDRGSSKRRREEDAPSSRPKKTREEPRQYDLIGNPYKEKENAATFVWAKKRQKEQQMGLSVDQAKARDQTRRHEAQTELSKLSARRAEREAEMAVREAESHRMAAISQNQAEADWIAKEDDFYLEQAKKRAEIRVRERRAKPIDYLALNLKWSGADAGFEQDDDDGKGLDVDLEEPYAIFENITLEETEELEQDIQMYLSLEKAQASVEFWRSMLLVCASVLEERRLQRRLGSAYAPQQRAHETLKAEFAKLLGGKTIEQLTALQQKVQAKLSSGEPIDVEYWENLLKELIVYRARSKLKDMHEVVLANRLEQLRRKQRDEAQQMQMELARQSTSKLPEADSSSPPQKEVWNSSMEPTLMNGITNDEKDLLLVEPDQARADLVAARRKVRAQRFVSRKQRTNDDDAPVNGVLTANRQKDLADAMYDAEAGQEMDEDEELFEMEAELTKQSYVWEDKYRPRKPRYFNKVMTGFEWNKYNQTHYDTDNPPPKVVNGYRMVLFYPDLIDKTKAPKFNIIKNPDNEDICTLVFKAGPPYEDVAFQIVNREWEYSHRRGFRCSFDRGVLSLAFTFRKLHYRK